MTQMENDTFIEKLKIMREGLAKTKVKCELYVKEIDHMIRVLGGE